MNFNGVFDEWNHMTDMTVEQLEESVRDMVLNDIKLRQSKDAKAWVKKPQFMDYVVTGMRNFLKSPFTS